MFDLTNLSFLQRVLDGKVEVLHFDGEASLTTSFSDILDRGVPTNRFYVIVGIALDNTVAGDLDILIDGKSAIPQVMRINSFPSNKNYRPIYIVVKPGSRFTIRAKVDSGTATLPFDVMVFSVRG